MSEVNKLIPELRFTEFEDDGEWQEKKLRDVCEINPKVLQIPDQFVYIDLESVENGFLLQKKIINKEGSPSRAQRLLNDKDVIFQMVRPYQKNNYYFRKGDSFDYVASTGYAQLRAFQSPEYLYQYLHTDIFVDRVLKKCTGSNYPAINSSDLSEISISLPLVLEEQQKIASCLSSLDELIAAHSQKLELLKEHKKSLMQTLFPQEGEKIPAFRFPEFVNDEEWISTSIEKLISENILFPPKDGNHGNIHPKSADYVKTGIPFIMASDLKNGKIDFSRCAYLKKEQADLLQKGFAKSGDVLLTHKGTVGEVALLSDLEFPYLMLTPQVTYYRIKDSAKMSNIYLASFFKSSIFQEDLLKVSGGGTRAYIGITEQQKLKINYPLGIKEQQKIASCLSSVDELITAQANKIEQLKLHKKGLMQGLFPKMSEL